MCRFASLIVTRTYTDPLYLQYDHSHDNIKEEFKLRDDKVENRNLVNIEVLPKTSLVSTKYKDWAFTARLPDTRT